MGLCILAKVSACWFQPNPSKQIWVSLLGYWHSQEWHSLDMENIEHDPNHQPDIGSLWGSKQRLRRYKNPPNDGKSYPSATSFQKVLGSIGDSIGSSWYSYRKAYSETGVICTNSAIVTMGHHSVAQNHPSDCWWWVGKPTLWDVTISSETSILKLTWHVGPHQLKVGL